jgi:hypothetical protein
MNRWRVEEDRRSKEMDGCPLTDIILCYKNHSEHTQLAVQSQAGDQLADKGCQMSRCPLQCSTCRVEDKHEAKIQKSTTSQINTC